MESICAVIEEHKNNLTIENIYLLIQLLKTVETQHPEYRQPKYEYDAYGNICGEVLQEMNYCFMCDVVGTTTKLCKEKCCNAYLCQDCEKIGCIRCKECNELKVENEKYKLTCSICNELFPGLTEGSCDLFYKLYCKNCKIHNPDI
jgi:hypothetical protein